MCFISSKPTLKDQRRAWRSGRCLAGAFVLHCLVIATAGASAPQAAPKSAPKSAGKPAHKPDVRPDIRVQPLPAAPLLADHFKPEALARVLKDREAVSSARLEDPDYRFSLAVLVRASHQQVWQTLTTYGLYEKLIPMIEKSEFDPVKKRLELAGGIFGFNLRSFLKFRVRTPQWLEYEVVEGHFVGMRGHLITQDAGEKGVIVALLGSHSSSRWPPKFVMEEGAKIVLSLTANKMRSYIEELKRQK